MNKIVIIAVIVIGIILLGLAFSGATNPYIETPFEQGVFGQEIKLNYADGSEDNLKIVAGNAILALFSDGKKVTSMSYRLRAKFTGDYNSVDIDMSGYKIYIDSQKTAYDIYSCRYGVGEPFSWQDGLQLKSGVYQKTDDWITLCHTAIYPTGIIPEIANGVSVPDGIYTVNVIPTGAITYTVDGYSEEFTPTLPETVTFTMEKKPDSLQIVWDQTHDMG